MPIRRRHLAGLAWATSAAWATSPTSPTSPASSALAAGSAAQTCPTLRVGVLVFPGLNQRGPGGSIEGFDAEIAAELSRRSGCALAVEESNASRLWPTLSRGELALSATLGYLPERMAAVDYLLLFRLRGFVQMRRELALRIPSQAAFDADPTLRLGIVRKALRPASVQAWVDALAAQGRVSESTDSASLLRAYEAGRVHAMLVFAGSMRDQPAAWQAEQRFFAWWPDYWQTFGWAASRAAVAAEWRERLRAAAEAARKDGSLQRLAQRYWGGFGEPMFEVLAAPPG